MQMCIRDRGKGEDNTARRAAGHFAGARVEIDPEGWGNVAAINAQRSVAQVAHVDGALRLPANGHGAKVDLKWAEPQAGSGRAVGSRARNDEHQTDQQQHLQPCRPQTDLASQTRLRLVGLSVAGSIAQKPAAKKPPTDYSSTRVDPQHGRFSRGSGKVRQGRTLPEPLYS